MNDRTPPNWLLGVAAVAAAFCTLAVATLPASVKDPAGGAVAARAATEVAISPAHIEVIGVRPRDAAHNETATGTRADPT